jgi:hypothetical protein
MVDAMRLSSDATPRDVKGHDNRRSIQSTASYASIKLGVDAAGMTNVDAWVAEHFR